MRTEIIYINIFSLVTQDEDLEIKIEFIIEFIKHPLDGEKILQHYSNDTWACRSLGI